MKTISNDEDKPRKEWISKETWAKMKAKGKLVVEGKKEEAKTLQKNIFKMLRKDKAKFLKDQVDENLDSRNRWKGIKEQKAVFQPKRYARNDMRGKPVPLDRRADATAGYLAKVQWGKKPLTPDQ